VVQQGFVGRQAQLEQLGSFLDQALQRYGQIAFVVGEAGSGKTALLTEFTRRADAAHRGLVTVVGNCNAQTGIGDPYLPFREILAQLTGDVEARLARGATSARNARRLQGLVRWSCEALMEFGPDLINTLVPGAGLVTKAGKFVLEQAGWLDKLQQLVERRTTGPARTALEQSHIFEQYTNVLKALAKRRPLVLVLDDLQWADSASISLLFHLGRRIAESRILVLGAYRPEEVQLGRGGEHHPLDKVLAEFKRYYGGIWIDLDQVERDQARPFVDALLDLEPNRLGEGFRQALVQHTGGHPLFAVELLRDLQEQGDLELDAQGCWVQGPALDWDALPPRVEGVIEERIGRLEAELRETLTVGSVEGEEFTAEVIARVREVEERGLVRRLSAELDRQHHLVVSQGIRRLGLQALSSYCFRHNLFQKYLYDNLDAAERTYLHQDVGTALEALYGDQVTEIAAQLGRHFREAGLAERASHYLRRAGEQAAAHYANAEALDYFAQALDLMPEGNLAERYALLLAREEVYDLLGERDHQRRDLAAIEQLAETLDDSRQRAEVALRRANLCQLTSDYPAAITASQEAIRLAQRAQDTRSEATGYLRWGAALWRQTNYDAARSRLERAVAMAREAGLGSVEARALTTLGNIFDEQGDYGQATAYYEQALLFHRETRNRRSEGRLLNNLAIVATEQGDYARARIHLEEALHISREIGDRLGESRLLNNLGAVATCQEELTAAIAYFEQGLRICDEIGRRGGKSVALGNTGGILIRLGDYAGAKACIEQAMAIDREIGDRGRQSFWLAYLGLLLHHLGDHEAAVKSCYEALLIAQEVGTRSAQGFALSVLGHALAGLGRFSEAIGAYQQALTLRREFGQPGQAMEALAGLARVFLALGESAQAQAKVREILRHLENGTLEGTEEPFLVYLTCYRVLCASQDPHAEELLDQAYRSLQKCAAKIGDQSFRRSFLEEVTAHREIVKEWTIAREARA